MPKVLYAEDDREAFEQLIIHWSARPDLIAIEDDATVMDAVPVEAFLRGYSDGLNDPRIIEDQMPGSLVRDVREITGREDVGSFNRAARALLAVL